MRHFCALVALCGLCTLTAVSLPAYAATTKKVVVVGDKKLDLGGAVVVVPGDASSLKAAAKKWDAAAIAKALDKSGADVLVRVEKKGNALTVTGFGADGSARFTKLLGSPADAARIVAPLIASGASTVSSGPRDDDDILSPASAPVHAAAAAKAPVAAAPSRVVAAKADDDDDDAPSRAMVVAKADDASAASQSTERSRVSGMSFDDDAPKTPKKADAPKKAEPAKKRASIDDDAAPAPAKAEPAKKHASIDDDDAPAAKKSDDDDKPARKSDDDDDAAQAKPAASHRSSLDDDGDSSSAKSDEPEHKKVSIDEVEADLKAHPLEKLRHNVAISAGLDGGVWSYDFSGGTAATALKTGAGIVPGGSVQVDMAPLAFAGIHFFGIDADLGAGEHTFTLQQGANAASPASFTSVEMRYGVAAKARYTFDNGIGLGGRIGYRYQGAGSAQQTLALNNKSVNVTQVPGYGLDALAVGADIFLPMILAEHRLEIDVRAEALPFALYKEVPDNPGSSITALGWHGQVAARYDMYSGLFLELRGETTGVHVSYADQGTRQVVDGGQVATLNGGRVYNMTGTGTMALGFMF